ncbi:hypothetical protein HK099_000070 [Clydaea vesicula]|uniref:C2H2-type domain-containing protein n=1 Tax=Clydaea vesicula TaxID=447962 RepID=A0AAD5UB08_9FUNG|nr:hypothetical protein HK099_000070 [Clydaea vesicula]KAJ3389713.1 hypothetical protein HDU92_000911 [Lobulomyces angularis]
MQVEINEQKRKRVEFEIENEEVEKETYQKYFKITNESDLEVRCFVTTECSFKLFASVEELEFHKQTKHNLKCVECNKHLHSKNFLNLHIQELHDPFFKILKENKPMYQCLIETCVSKKKNFKSIFERNKHMVSKHELPYESQVYRLLGYPRISVDQKKKVDSKIEKELINEKILESKKLHDLILGISNLQLPKEIHFGKNAQKGFDRK